jgi:TetR/AcrR family transcriptional regulator, transcriptional repressor for nem operon
MQDRRELNAEADVAELATGVVAALQGGLILAQAARSEKPLRAALDLAVGRVALAAPLPTWHARRTARAGDVSAGPESGFTTAQPHVPGAAR